MNLKYFSISIFFICLFWCRWRQKSSEKPPWALRIKRAENFSQEHSCLGLLGRLRKSPKWGSTGMCWHSSFDAQSQRRPDPVRCWRSSLLRLWWYAIPSIHTAFPIFVRCLLSLVFILSCQDTLIFSFLVCERVKKSIQAMWADACNYDKSCRGWVFSTPPLLKMHWPECFKRKCMDQSMFQLDIYNTWIF